MLRTSHLHKLDFPARNKAPVQEQAQVEKLEQAGERTRARPALDGAGEGLGNEIATPVPRSCACMSGPEPQAETMNS